MPTNNNPRSRPGNIQFSLLEVSGDSPCLDPACQWPKHDGCEPDRFTKSDAHGSCSRQPQGEKAPFSTGIFSSLGAYLDMLFLLPTLSNLAITDTTFLRKQGQQIRLTQHPAHHPHYRSG